MIFKLIFLLSEKCVFIKNNNNCYYLVLFEKSDSMRYINHFLKIYFFLLINKYFQKCLLPDECYFWLLKFLFIYFPLFKLKYKKSILCGQSAWKYHCFINIYFVLVKLLEMFHIIYLFALLGVSCLYKKNFKI